MKDEHKTKEQLVNELVELRQRITELEESETERERAQRAAEEACEYAEAILATVREPLVVLDANLKVISANRSFYQTFQVTPEETEGRFIYDLGNRQWDIPRLRNLLEEILPRNTTFDDFVVRHEFETIGDRMMLLNARQIHREANKAQMILLAIEDITERRRAEEQIKASLREKEVLLMEIHHRVKNNLQIVSSLLNLQSGYVADKQVLDMLKTNQERLRSMALVHELLYRSPDLARIDFGAYIRELAEHLVSLHAITPGAVTLEIEVEELPLGTDVAIPCGLMVTELVINSLRHAFPKGRKGKIRIALRPQDDNKVMLTVGDDGVGFPEALDFRNVSSLGMQLVMSLTHQLKASIDLSREKGTEWRILFTPPE